MGTAMSDRPECEVRLGGRHGRTGLFAGILASAIFLIPPMPAHAANADQIYRLLTSDAACGEDAAKSLSESARKGIENAVRRAEAAIKAPIPTGDLACLDDLMDLNLDFAIPLPDLGGMFAGAVSNATDKLCSFAKEKWDDLTKPLDANFDLGIPGFQDGWGDFNFGGSDSSGGYTPPPRQSPDPSDEGNDLLPQRDVECTAPQVPMFDPGSWSWSCMLPSSGVTPQMQENWNSIWGQGGEGAR